MGDYTLSIVATSIFAIVIIAAKGQRRVQVGETSTWSRFFTAPHRR